MADVKKETILLEIDTNFGDVIEEIGKLQTRIDLLNDEKRDMVKENKKLIESNKELSKEYEKNREEIAKNEKIIQLNNEKIAENEVKIRNLTQTQREHKKEIDNEIKAYQENEGSIKQMRLELKKLRDEYEGLSKADRESQGGQNMLSDIQKKMEEVKNLEKAQGDFRREVGHYSTALEGLEPILGKTIGNLKTIINVSTNVSVAIKNVIPSIKAFGAQLLKLAVNPVVLAILAVVAALKKLVDQFKMNDEAMTALQQLFASFQPIIDIFVGALDKAVQGLSKFIGWVTKGVTALFSLIPAFKESSEAAQDYVKSMDALEEKEREYSVQTAKNDAQISELRAKALQKDKYSAEQRKQFLEEAGQLEKENLRMEMEVAQEKLRLAKEDAERRHDTSDDTKNKIAELEANVWHAVKSYNDGMRAIVKATQKAKKEIDKEVNDNITFSQWQKGMAERKKAYEEAKKAYNEALANWGANKTDAEAQAQLEAAREMKEQKEAELNNYKELEEDAKKHSKELVNIAKQRSKNLLEARRNYEQAVLDLMDESLEKQLKELEKQNEQEIDALKEKLATEENLTAEARDLILKTIELKQKKFYERLIIMESNYWSSVRQNAIEAINSILDTESKLASTDPNRNIQQFILNLRKQLIGVASEFESFGDSLSESFQTQFQALKSKASTVLGELAGDDKSNKYSKKVKELLIEITNGIGKFSKENTKNIDQFYNNIAQRQRELEFTEEDVRQFSESVKPYYERINELYEQYIQIPKNYATETANIIYNELKNSAKKIQESIFKSFSFDGLSDDFIKKVNEEVKEIDGWLRTINLTKMIEENGGKIEGLSFAQSFEVDVDWSKVGKDADKYAKMYGNKLSKTLSGALKLVSGSDDIETQLEWLVANYEKAIKKINQYNEDLLAAYQKSGDENFLKAMFDTATIEPELRRLHDIALENGKDTTNYEMQKLEVQKKYVGESDRELKIQNDLLQIENERLTKKKQQETAQLNYAQSVRGEVEELEKETNKEVSASRANIALKQETIQKRKEEAQEIRENVKLAQEEAEKIKEKIKLVEEDKKLTKKQKEELIGKLQADLDVANQTIKSAQDEVRRVENAIGTAQEEIRKLEEKIAKLLEKLAETGFMSTEQVDETIKQLGLSIAQTDAQIQENTQQTTQNVRTMWLNTFTNITGGIGQVSSAFNSLFTEMGEMNERYDKYAEAAAYFTIMLQMAEGIATAVAKGIEMGWPAAAVMIPVGIATVVGGIASALSVYNQAHKPNYAEGGLIGGRYARTRSEGRRDDVPINASVGEYVVNAKATKQYRELLDLINFGDIKFKMPKTHFADGGYVSQTTSTAINDVMQNQMMTDMMTEAVAQIQPVVAVREIARVQNRVKVKEAIAKNK